MDSTSNGGRLGHFVMDTLYSEMVVSNNVVFLIKKTAMDSLVRNHLWHMPSDH